MQKTSKKKTLRKGLSARDLKTERILTSSQRF